MVSLNVLMIRRTGRKIASSLAMLVGLTPSIGAVPVAEPKGSPKRVEAPTSQPCPLLGMYADQGKDGVVLSCDRDDLDPERDLVCLKRDGTMGLVHDASPLKGRPAGKVGARKPAVEEKVTAYICNGKMHHYAAKINYKTNEPPNKDIGFILNQGCVVTKPCGPNKFEVSFRGQSFVINHYLSSECLHVTCTAMASRKELAHFAFALGYEVEPETT